MHISRLSKYLNNETNTIPVYKSPGVYTEERQEHIVHPSPLREIEPSRTNRFLITIEDSPDILVWYFRNYKISMENNLLYVDIEIMETLNYTLNPVTDFEHMTRFKIENLDPTGVTVGTIRFTAGIVNFERSCDYADDGIVTDKLRFVIDRETYISETPPRPPQIQTDLIPEFNRLGIDVNYTATGVSGWSGTNGS